MKPAATARTNKAADQAARWSVLFSSNQQDWATPQDFFQEINAEFYFTLDACATNKNAKCPRYFTPTDDGLCQNGGTERVWCNPPYNNIARWLTKGHDSARLGALVVFLIPARTDTRAWHEHAVHANEILFLKGRLKFGNAKNTAPFPSAIIVFRPPQRQPLQLALFEPALVCAETRT